jgi:hypothetical protein
MMDDILQRVSGQEDFFKKILPKIPGFKGYVDREDRRAADKLLREGIADRFETLWGRISEIQKEAVSNGELKLVGELESAAIKLRQFIDRVRTASYGYAGFFDPIKIKTEELDQIYQYDYELLAQEDEVSRAIDNVSSSYGTDGLPAAIRHLTTLSQGCLDTFDRRKEVIVNMSENTPE